MALCCNHPICTGRLEWPHVEGRLQAALDYMSAQKRKVENDKEELVAELQNLLRLTLQLVPFIGLRCPFLLAFLCLSTLYMLRNPLLQ